MDNFYVYMYVCRTVLFVTLNSVPETDKARHG